MGVSVGYKAKEDWRTEWVNYPEADGFVMSPDKGQLIVFNYEDCKVLKVADLSIVRNVLHDNLDY